MDRKINCQACWRPPSTRSTTRWRQAAPCSSSNDAIRKTTRTAVADYVVLYLQRMQIYNCTVCQLVFECVASAQICLLKNKRHNRWTSRASSVYWCPWCVSGRCAVYARGFEACPTPPRAGGHHPHCKRPRGPPSAHFPSDPAFVPRGLVVGAVACYALVPD